MKGNDNTALKRAEELVKVGVACGRLCFACFVCFVEIIGHGADENTHKQHTA